MSEYIIQHYIIHESAIVPDILATNYLLDLVTSMIIDFYFNDLFSIAGINQNYSFHRP